MNTDERQEMILREMEVSIVNLDKMLSVHTEKFAEHERQDAKVFDNFRIEMQGLRADLKVIKDVFGSFGKGKSFIITLAMILVSIIAIFGSVKTIIEWLKKAVNL